MSELVRCCHFHAAQLRSNVLNQLLNLRPQGNFKTKMLKRSISKENVSINITEKQP